MLKKNSRLLPNLAKQKPKPNCTHAFIYSTMLPNNYANWHDLEVHISHTAMETRPIFSEKKYLVPNLSRFPLIHTLKEHLILQYKQWPHQDFWRTFYFPSLTPSSKEVPLALQLPWISKNWSTSHMTVPWTVTLAPKWHSIVNKVSAKVLIWAPTNLFPKITCLYQKQAVTPCASVP